MIYQIDLHGLTHDQAVLKTEKDIVEISLDQYSSIEIITGKSTYMQQRIINEVLDLLKFRYYIPVNNSGMIVVIHDQFKL